MSLGFFWNVKKKNGFKGIQYKILGFLYLFFILYTFIVIQSGTPGWWVGALLIIMLGLT